MDEQEKIREGREELDQMQRDKERRIGEYLQLQDRADDLNEKIYHLCCGIETLNGRIEMKREELRKLEARAALDGRPVNGIPRRPRA